MVESKIHPSFASVGKEMFDRRAIEVSAPLAVLVLLLAVRSSATIAVAPIVQESAVPCLILSASNSWRPPEFVVHSFHSRYAEHHFA